MAEKKLGFFESFMLSGVAAGVSKTAAAPIERIKLLVQNQDEMIKQGRLDKPYNGSLTASDVSLPQRVSTHCGVVTWPMSFVTSLPRLLTSPSRTALRQSSPPPRTPLPNVNSPPTSLLVELLVLCPFSSYTPWTTPEPGLPMTTSPRLELVSSMVSLMST